jgi:hypothetical protein
MLESVFSLFKTKRAESTSPIEKGTVLSNENLPLTFEQRQALRVGYAQDPTIALPVDIPFEYKHGNGPYPVIDKEPSIGMILSNMNKVDIYWGLSVPIVACLAAYQMKKGVNNFYFKYALCMGTLGGIVNSTTGPYNRLIGHDRNDSEAARYLGWKLPIYYDVDFLLGTPGDSENATIITQDPRNLPTHLQSRATRLN